MKKILNPSLIVTIFIFIGVTLNAQWVKRASLSGPPRRGAVSWTINNKLYVVGGGPGQNLSEYNPATNTWTGKAALPWTTARYLGVGFVINGKGYICTGTDGVNSIYYNDLWMYDPATNAWSAKTAFPGNPRVLGFGFSIGDKAYVGAGGDASLFYQDMYEYNSQADTWATKSNFPGGFRVQLVSAGFNTDGYVGAGVEYSTTLNDFINHNDLYRYTPATDTWNVETTIPGPVRLSAVCMASSEHIYIGTGTDSQLITAGNIYKDFYRYDPLTSVWDTLPDMPFGRAYATGAFLNGKPYVATGGNTSADFSDLWTFSVSIGSDVSAEENVRDKGLFVFPSPADNMAMLHTPKDCYYDLVITNTAGEEMKRLEHCGNNSKINCSELANGIYILRFLNKKEAYTLRIVVCH